MATLAAKLWRGAMGAATAPRPASWTARMIRPPSDAEDEDEQLLARSLRLEPAALALVHDRYYPRVYRYLLLRCGEAALAEDLAGEVFLRFMQALRRAGRAPDSLRAWLFGVAAHVWADQQRQDYRRSRLAPRVDDRPAAEPEPEAAAEQGDLAERLLGALADLTEEQREVLALRFQAELPIRDVARSLGKTEGAIKQLQARAVATLGRLLAGERSTP